MPTFAAAERFLHLAIKALIDLGNHVIAELEWAYHPFAAADFLEQ